MSSGHPLHVSLLLQGRILVIVERLTGGNVNG
jgi:hypothetical protein